VRGLNGIRTEATKVVVALVVSKDDNKIRLLLNALFSSGDEKTDQEA
jgi:hypothetical protein